MSSPETLDQDGSPESQGEEPQRIEMEVAIKEPSACERHVVVTIPRTEIERYFDKTFSEMMPSAQVPGFRSGRAPRKLVESRYRKELAPQVKGSLLLDSITQIGEEQDLSAISEPDFDVDAVELPEEGPMVFEYRLEVRPEFSVPHWKGLELEKPTREFSKEDVERRKNRLLAQHGRLVPSEKPAEKGDYVTVNLSFHHGDKQLSRSEEEVIRIRPELSFRDGKIEGFDKLMKGAKEGDVREGEAQLSEDAPNADLRGQAVTAKFEVLDVKKLEMPKLTPEFLDELGGFESEADLLDAVKDDLERQLEYHQSQRTRQQVTAQLTEAATWELPPDLLRRQSQRELQRSVLELRRSGFSEDEIRAHANMLQQNSLASTARSLKEHFILEKIAEEEAIEDIPSDYDDEIALIAAQSDESPRRVRARLEKRGMMDVLRNQIIERKTLARVYEHAKFKEVAFELEESETEALDQSAGGGDQEESEIPDALHDDTETSPVPGSKNPT